MNHVSPDDAPTRIIHGDKDVLVPIQQAELIVTRLKEVAVPAEVIIKPGAGHGWPNIGNDMPTIVDWFDKYLHGKSMPQYDPRSELRRL